MVNTIVELLEGRNCEEQLKPDDVAKLISKEFDSESSFSNYIEEVVRYFVSKRHNKLPLDESVEDLKCSIEKLKYLNAFLEHSNFKKYGALSNLKKRLDSGVQTLEHHLEKKQSGLRNLQLEDNSIDDKILSAYEFKIKNSYDLFFDSFAKWKDLNCRDLILYLIIRNEVNKNSKFGKKSFDRTKIINTFNEKYADLIRAKKISEDSLKYFEYFKNMPFFDFSVTNTDLFISAPINELKNTYGAVVGRGNATFCLNISRKDQEPTLSPSIFKIEFWYDSIEDLKRTDYKTLQDLSSKKSDILNSKNKSRDPADDFSFLSIHLDDFYKIRKSRQDLCRIIGEYTKQLVFVSKLSIDTDYFEARGEKHDLRVEIKAEGSKDHRVYFKMELFNK